MGNNKNIADHGAPRRGVILVTPAISDEFEGEENPFWILEVSPNRFRLLESSCFIFSDFLLLYGDEVIVEKSGDNTYRVIEVVTPSAMLHSFYVGGSPQGHQTFTDMLHEIGGEWECDMGGIPMVHVPRAKRDEYEKRMGCKLGEETFGGFRPASDFA